MPTSLNDANGTEKGQKISKGTPIGLKNFKKSPEVENFYRFVSENRLRREAYLIFSALFKKLKIGNKKKKTSKRTRARKASKTIQ